MRRVLLLSMLAALLAAILPAILPGMVGSSMASSALDSVMEQSQADGDPAPGAGQVIWEGGNESRRLTGVQPGSASALQDLQLSALWITPSSPRANEPFTITFDLYNPTGGYVNIPDLGIGLRGPDACAFDNPWQAPMPPQPQGWTGQGIAAGSQARFIRSYPAGQINKPGHYILEPVYKCEGCTNPYPPFQNSSPIWFDVRNNNGDLVIPNCLVVEEPLRITPEHPRPGDTVTANFTIRNRTSESITLNRLLAAGRSGADWSSTVNADFADAPGAPRVLAPGETYNYHASRSYDETGAYFAEPWRQSGSTKGGIWGGNRVNRYVADWVCGLNDVPLYFQGAPSTPVTPGYPARVRWAKQAMGQRAWYTDTIMSGDTMGNWGCLVTAHAMVFGYLAKQGRTPWWANPSDLNQWLRSGNDDGYSNLDLVWNNALRYPAAMQKSFFVQRDDNSANDEALTQAVCQGNPAIIFIPTGGDSGHWVTVTGVVRNSQGETYALNDPIWGQTTLAEHYPQRYSSLRIYRSTATRPSRPAMTMYAAAAQPAIHAGQATQVLQDSPVQLLVTDPLGRKTGYDPSTGATWNEIPGSTYGSYSIRQPDGASTPRNYELTIAEPLDGDYSVQAIGQAAGDYAVQVTTQDPESDAGDRIYTGAATAGSQESYSYTYPPAASTAGIFLPAIQVAPSPTPVPTPTPTPDPDAARLRVDPPSGVSGTRFEIYGENFGANEAVDEWVITPGGERWDDPTPQQTDDKGKFRSWIEMTSVSTGVYTLYARGQKSERQASTTIEIAAGK